MKIRNYLSACNSEVLKIYRAEEIAQLIKCLVHSMSPEFNPYHPPKRQVQRHVPGACDLGKAEAGGCLGLKG